MAAALRSESRDFSLLPKDRTFGELLPAFFLPYFAYVAIPGFLSELIGPDLAQLLRFAVVGGLLLRFRKAYAFGPRLTAPQALLALAAAAFGVVLWTAALRLCLAMPFFADKLAKASTVEYSLLYAALRTANSVLLVPVFEELLFRVWMQEALHPAPAGPEKSRLLDQRPQSLTAPPLTFRAVGIAGFLFAFGHDPAALPAAVLYYLLTTAVYAWTRSIRVCILVHAVVNLALAAAVMLRPDFKYLWF
ncbi:MAG TPA: CPBP family intramembrane glutamic endopeptidase [Fibrobacteria bacterium]|nr:CPBP family intramembrane glutamic endopeptidase [Fibrobacteria bacterium]